MFGAIARALGFRGLPDGVYFYRELADDEAAIEKAAGHKYTHRKFVGIRTDPRTGRQRRVYRYYYAVQRGGGIHRQDFAVGDAYAIAHDGVVGHYHVTAVDGDKITVYHDEAGVTLTMTRDELHAALASHHAKALEAHRDKLRADLAAVERHGTVKQQARLRAEAARHGVAPKRERVNTSAGAARERQGGGDEAGEGSGGSAGARDDRGRGGAGEGGPRRASGKRGGAREGKARGGAATADQGALDLTLPAATPKAEPAVGSQFAEDFVDTRPVDTAPDPQTKNPAIAVHPDLMPEITVKLADDIRRFKRPRGHMRELFPHQVEGAERILTALAEGDGVILSDDAGLGKTNTALASIAALKPERAVVVVPTAGKAGIRKQWLESADLFGLQAVEGLPENADSKGLFVVSYDEIYDMVPALDADGQPMLTKKGAAIMTSKLKPSLADGSFGVVAFDEAHSMNNDESQRADAGKALADRSEKAIYMSATPFQGIGDMHYLTKLGLFGSDRESFVSWAVDSGARLQGRTLVNPGMMPMAAVAATLHVDGKAIKRTTSLEGVTSGFKLKREVTAQEAKVFDKADKVFDIATRGTVLPASMVNAFKSSWSRQFWETLKIQEAIDLGREALGRGEQVAFFTSYKSADHAHLRALVDIARRKAARLADGESPGAAGRAAKLEAAATEMEAIIESLPPVPSAVDELVKAFGGPKVVAEIHGNTRKKPEEEQDAYQSGAKRVVVATMARGGTGISLHDTKGTAPRTQINLSLPWSGREFNQVAGRSHRLGSRSDTRMHWLVGDDALERRNASAVSARLKAMGALTTGDTLQTAEAGDMARWEFGEDDITENIGDVVKQATADDDEHEEEAAETRDFFRAYAERRKAGADVTSEAGDARAVRDYHAEHDAARKAIAQLQAKLDEAGRGHKLNVTRHNDRYAVSIEDTARERNGYYSRDTSGVLTALNGVGRHTYQGRNVSPADLIRAARNAEVQGLRPDRALIDRMRGEHYEHDRRGAAIVVEERGRRRRERERKARMRPDAAATAATPAPAAPPAPPARTEAEVARDRASHVAAAYRQRGIHLSHAGGRVHLSGKTYDHKDTIKRLGGRWSSGSREWVIPSEKLEPLAVRLGLVTSSTLDAIGKVQKARERTAVVALLARVLGIAAPSGVYLYVDALEGEEPRPPRVLKAQGHRYRFRKYVGTRTVTNKDGSSGTRKVYRYYYEDHHAAHVADPENIREGFAFALADQGKLGHFHVIAVSGDRVRIRHDETGTVRELTKMELVAHIHHEHAKAIETKRNAVTRDLAAATANKATDKQRARLRDELKRYSPAEPPVGSLALATASAKRRGRAAERAPQGEARKGERPAVDGATRAYQAELSRELRKPAPSAPTVPNHVATPPPTPLERAAKARVRGGAATFFETEVAEIADDPKSFGVEGDEADAYKLAAKHYANGVLTFPADDKELETLASFVGDAASAASDRAEHHRKERDPEQRRYEQQAADSLSKLQSKLVEEVKKRQPATATGPAADFTEGTYTSKRGNAKRVAVMGKRLPANDYLPIVALARKHGGSFVRDAGGFVFGKDEGYDAFMRELATPGAADAARAAEAAPAATPAPPKAGGSEWERLTPGEEHRVRAMLKEQFGHALGDKTLSVDRVMEMLHTNRVAYYEQNHRNAVADLRPGEMLATDERFRPLSDFTARALSAARVGRAEGLSGRDLEHFATEYAMGRVTSADVDPSVLSDIAAGHEQPRAHEASESARASRLKTRSVLAEREEQRRPASKPPAADAGDHAKAERLVDGDMATDHDHALRIVREVPTVADTRKILSAWQHNDPKAIEEVHRIAQVLVPGIRRQDAHDVVSHYAHGGGVTNAYREQMGRENRIVKPRQPRPRPGDGDDDGGGGGGGGRGGAVSGGTAGPAAGSATAAPAAPSRREQRAADRRVADQIGGLVDSAMADVARDGELWGGRVAQSGANARSIAIRLASGNASAAERAEAARILASGLAGMPDTAAAPAAPKAAPAAPARVAPPSAATPSAPVARRHDLATSHPVYHVDHEAAGAAYKHAAQVVADAQALASGPALELPGHKIERSTYDPGHHAVTHVGPTAQAEEVGAREERMVARHREDDAEHRASWPKSVDGKPYSERTPEERAAVSAYLARNAELREQHAQERARMLVDKFDAGLVDAGKLRMTVERQRADARKRKPTMTVDSHMQAAQREILTRVKDAQDHAKQRAAVSTPQGRYNAVVSKLTRSSAWRTESPRVGEHVNASASASSYGRRLSGVVKKMNTKTATVEELDAAGRSRGQVKVETSTMGMPQEHASQVAMAALPDDDVQALASGRADRLNEGAQTLQHAAAEIDRRRAAGRWAPTSGDRGTTLKDTRAALSAARDARKQAEADHREQQHQRAVDAVDAWKSEWKDVENVKRKPVDVHAMHADELKVPEGHERRTKREAERFDPETGTAVIRTTKDGKSSWHVAQYDAGGSTTRVYHDRRRDAMAHYEDAVEARGKRTITPEHLDMAAQLEAHASKLRAMPHRVDVSTPYDVATHASDMKRTAHLLRSGIVEDGSSLKDWGAHSGKGYFHERHSTDSVWKPLPKAATPEQMAAFMDDAHHSLGYAKAIMDGKGTPDFDQHPDAWRAREALSHARHRDRAWEAGYTFRKGAWKPEHAGILAPSSRDAAAKALQDAGLALVPHGHFPVRPSTRISKALDVRGAFLARIIKAAAVKYVRKVPTGRTTKTGRPIFRYYYSAAKGVQQHEEGDVINLGGSHGTHQVTRVRRDGQVELRHTETGATTTMHSSEILEHLHAARGAAIHAAAARYMAGILRSSQIPDGAKALPAVTRAFEAAGVDASHAKAMLTFLARREGWGDDAKAALRAMAVHPKWGKLVAPSWRQVAAGAENLALAQAGRRARGAGAKDTAPKDTASRRVTAAHVGAAVAARFGSEASGGEHVDRLRASASEALGKLEGALAAVEAMADHEGAVRALVTRLGAAIMGPLAELDIAATAYPGLRDMPEFERLTKARGRWQAVAAAGQRKSDGGKGLAGAETTVYVAGPDGSAVPQAARYRLVEAGDLVASHVATEGFKPHAAYPEGVQERAYHRDKAEQEKVRMNATRLRPDLVANTNPDAVNGPPLMTRDAIVLGGNSRTMTLQLAYEEHPDKAKGYSDYLAKHAQDFGFTAEDVAGMKRPVLVREVDVPSDDRKDLGVLVRRYNEAFTQAMDPRTDQVAKARLVSDKMMTMLAQGMEAQTGGGEDRYATLNAMLSSKSDARPFVEAMQSAGIIDRRNRSAYLRKDGSLNEDGKTFVERLLVGRLIPHPDTLAEVPPAQMAAIAAAVPHVARAAANGHDISDDLSQAVRLRVWMGAQRNMDEDLRAYDAVQTFGGLMGGGAGFEDKPPISARGRELFDVLVHKKPRERAEFFRRFAQLATRHQVTTQTNLGVSGEAREGGRSTDDLLKEALAPPQTSLFKAWRWRRSRIRKAQIDMFGHAAPPAPARGGGPYYGPRGGRYADPGHTRPWRGGGGGKAGGASQDDPAERQRQRRLEEIIERRHDLKRGDLIKGPDGEIHPIKTFRNTPTGVVVVAHTPKGDREWPIDRVKKHSRPRGLFDAAA